MDKIILANIKTMGNHGVNPLEKIVKQPFNISVTLYLDLAPAAASDDLAHTIHYGILYERIKNHVESTHYDLIEALAGSISDIIFEDERVEKTKVTVEKVQARINNSIFSAAVVIKRNKDDKSREDETEINGQDR